MAIKYTEEQLNTIDKSLLVQMFLNQQEQLELLTGEVRTLNEKMQLMMEQIILGNKKRFGRSSEQMIDAHQIRFMEVDGNIVFFNEAEAVCDLEAPEPDDLEVKPARQVKTKGKKEQDMEGLPVNRINHVIQADETPCLVNRDGRKAGSKSYMWVYRTGFMYNKKPIILYEYQLTKNASHPRAFLKDYSGICVTDGYQVYHTLEKEKEDLLAHRQAIIQPLVEALFTYLKMHKQEVPQSGKLHEAFTYALNQEKYLKVFLTDGDVPLDNNASLSSVYFYPHLLPKVA